MNFRLRLIISFALLISLAFGVGGTLLISTSFYSILNEEKAAIIREYETVQNNLLMINHFGSDIQYNNMRALLSQMEEQNIAHWQAVSLKSFENVIYESGNQELLSHEISIVEDGTYAYTQLNEGKARNLLLYSELHTETTILYLTASFDLSSAYVHRENQLKMFLVIYVVVVLFGIGMAIVCSRLLTKRLQQLTNAAREIAGGNLSIRTGLRTGDEFEQLSRDFDSMTDKLQDNILKLEEDVQRKEAFMGAVAHELKTPMTSIIGYADFIRQCALDENERMLAANYIYTEGQRLEKLSHKILDLLLMEKDTFTRKEIGLRNFLQQVIATTKPLAEEKEVALIWGCEDIQIQMEPDLGKSLLYNLIDNAIKATPAGGKVSVVGRKIAGGCELIVMDTGCGMNEQELSKITEAFYRVDKSRSRMQGGAGLGLTLCKKIVDLHHGNMTFQSKPGVGSRVTVQLFDKEVQNEKTAY